MNTPSRPRAYRVPFRVEREPGSTLYRLRNVGGEAVHGLSLTLHGTGVMRSSLPATLLPWETLEVTVAGSDLTRNAIVVVRWFRASGVEYLWRLTL